MKRPEGASPQSAIQSRPTPLAGDQPLVDVHAHFYHAHAGRADWSELNAARFRAGDRIGITWHVASVLGTYGHRSPTYFPSPDDVVLGNEAMVEIAEREPTRVRMYATVNPNYTAHALAEIERCTARGAVGIKLLASRRADDPLLDPIAELAAERGLPILHHIWQHRRREWPSQEISDGADLARLAARHPRATFILAHIGGGGDWSHTFPAIAEHPNVVPDLSGSGVDRGMLDAALDALGPRRLLWGCDLTMETGLAKLRALDAIGLAREQMELIRWRNAVRIFPPNTFPGLGERAAPGVSSPKKAARRTAVQTTDS
ncbi:MAG: amidohydrolase family protein [Gemmatimonadaceae bacterium]